MRTIEQMVQQEVCCCMSWMVSTLAKGYGAGIWDGGKAAKAVGDDLPNLIEQAFELACPISDYEEAALQAGCEAYTDQFGVACWRDNGDPRNTFAGTAQQVCEAWDIEPYDREVYEHWAVSTWFAEKLIAQGERVDTDFGGLNVWARTCSGQGIANDGVVEKIYAAMMAA